jgi:hypothetical protein
MRRREFLELAGSRNSSGRLDAQVPPSGPKADVTPHISPVEVEMFDESGLQPTMFYRW